MKTEIPDFLIEMSERMNSDPSRCTSHPFWQVRCKQYIVTAQGYNEHHWEIVDEEGIVFRSDIEDMHDLAEYFKEHHSAYFDRVVEDYRDDNELDSDVSDIDEFISAFDIDYEDLPDELTRIFVQEVEEIVWTGLTQAGAEAFIARKQHDYPKLYTYVESAYWSPELRNLQDWIKGLTNDSTTNNDEN